MNLFQMTEREQVAIHSNLIYGQLLEMQLKMEMQFGITFWVSVFKVKVTVTEKEESVLSVT